MTPQIIQKQVDIFGRERHADDRSDMGGIGSFSRENRTLYVGKVGLGFWVWGLGIGSFSSENRTLYVENLGFGV